MIGINTVTDKYQTGCKKAKDIYACITLLHDLQCNVDNWVIEKDYRLVNTDLGPNGALIVDTFTLLTI